MKHRFDGARAWLVTLREFSRYGIFRLCNLGNMVHTYILCTERIVVLRREMNARRNPASPRPPRATRASSRLSLYKNAQSRVTPAGKSLLRFQERRKANESAGACRRYDERAIHREERTRAIEPACPPLCLRSLTFYSVLELVFIVLSLFVAERTCVLGPWASFKVLQPMPIRTFRARKNAPIIFYATRIIIRQR